MSTVTYARPRLTTTHDKRYRAYVQQFLLQRKNQRAMRPPLQREIFGGQAEDALRQWLGQQQNLILSEQRILEYEERKGKRAVIKYRELDAVVIEDKRTIWVFEAKASRSANSLRRAVAQLQETRTILRLLYPYVHATILLVNTGIPTAQEVTELMTSPEPPSEPPETLKEVIESLEKVHTMTNLAERSTDGITLDLLLFDVDDIIAIAGAENLALDWSADDEQEATAPTQAPQSPIYSTSDDDADQSGGALAEALRRAGLG